MIDDMNEALDTSMIEAQLDLLCVGRINLPELSDPSAMLQSFQQYLRKT